MRTDALSCVAMDPALSLRFVGGKPEQRPTKTRPSTRRPNAHGDPGPEKVFREVHVNGNRRVTTVPVRSKLLREAHPELYPLYPRLKTISTLVAPGGLNVIMIK